MAERAPVEELDLLQDIRHLEELRQLEREASAERMRGHSVSTPEFSPRGELGVGPEATLVPPGGRKRAYAAL